ncbi:4628_t:CDS:2 [Acaulospora morrowiae]|uniref:4628_t:CDS:1 n=1 Tax=Acaulospora morrowiae TaxID=94023 RepID=A0A9N8WLJ1_9GLOM|nr:4628_t:CDS:2 [Acaulospora morrowiae]
MPQDTQDTTAQETSAQEITKKLEAFHIDPPIIISNLPEMWNPFIYRMRNNLRWLLKYLISSEVTLSRILDKSMFDGHKKD